ncbi:hypothetical protein HDU91_002246, partial [Kappamyces sp. JEL0680]
MLISCLSLAALAAAHMHLVSPAPKYTVDLGDANAPVYQQNGKCDLVLPDNSNGLAPKSNNFAQKLAAAGFASVRAYVDACAKKASKPVCGNTDPSQVVGFPTDSTVQIQVGANHIGIMEFWIDGPQGPNKIFSNVAQTGIGSTPLSTKVDFAAACPTGTCLARFVQVSLHVELPEIYDNCVGVNANGAVGAAPVPAPAPAAPAPAPAGQTTDASSTTAASPAATQTQPVVQITTTTAPTTTAAPDASGLEWTCEGTSLKRTVGRTAYIFAC